MRREVKARAWEPEKKKMLYLGEFEILAEPDNGLFSGAFKENGDWYELPLMFNTGIFTRDRDEIYDGDIIEDDEGQHFIVMWNDDGSWWADDINQGFYSMDLGEFDDNCVIIGNIYENPEMIKNEIVKR
jgi:hypothetical protein